MAAKFVNLGTDTQKDWAVEYKCESTGSKTPSIGDILKIKGRNVVVTEVVTQHGQTMAYGECATLRFVNH